MRKQNVFYLVALCAAVMVVNIGCADEGLFKGTDNSILALSLETKDAVYIGAIVGNEIVMRVPKGVDLTGARVEYRVSERAAIVPDPTTVVNWNNEQVFRVQSHAREYREYDYTVAREGVSRAGNVYIVTQADVDSLARDGVTIVDGNLVIGTDGEVAADSLLDLGGLAAIEEVRYNLIVNRSFAGKELKGLENLARCGGIQVGSVTAGVDFPAREGVVLELPGLVTTGDVVINSASVKKIVLGKLERAASVFIASSSLESLEAPVLEETVGRFSLENGAGAANGVLASVVFPRLERVGGRFSLQYFSGVEDVSFPVLAAVGGDVEIASNSSLLESIAFPALVEARGGIVIERAPGLKSLAFPVLTRAASFIYNKVSYGTYPLAALDLPALGEIGGELYIRGVALGSVAMPRLERVAGAVTFWDVKLATSVALPAIRHVPGKIQFYAASSLESLDLSRLDTITTLELVGCESLDTVGMPAAVGNITVNFSSKAYPPARFPRRRSRGGNAVIHE